MSDATLARMDIFKLLQHCATLEDGEAKEVENRWLDLNSWPEDAEMGNRDPESPQACGWVGNDGRP